MVMFPVGTRQEGAIVENVLDGVAYVALHEGVPILPVGILPVVNSQVVRRGGHHKIDAFICQSRHSLDTIFAPKIKTRH